MRRRTITSRVAAAALTGPAGHFVAGAVDWVVLFGRYWSARLRGRSLDDPGA